MEEKLLKLDLEVYPHWEKPYNQYKYKVYDIYGDKREFIHIDLAVEYYEHFGLRLYIRKKGLKYSNVLWKCRDKIE